MRFATIAIHEGQEPDPLTGAIVVPIFQASTFVQDAPGKHKGYEYSRTGNPTRAALEKSLAALEDGRFGLAFASGCAAVTAALSLLRPGDHVVAGDDLYGGTTRLFRHVFAPLGMSFTHVDTTVLRNVQAALHDSTRMVWIETPSNPMLRITDIAGVAGICKEGGILSVVDNTFASPCLQRPLSHGADVVLHSTTKYIGGHTDVIGGALVANDANVARRLAFYQNAAGAVPSPFDCFLALRGIRTLAVRMERHCSNAQKIAEFLSRHSRVKRVNYPGLPDHPQHEVAKRQMSGFGGMVSFEIDGDMEGAKAIVSRTKIFALAESLGGVESLIEHPGLMTHASLSAEEKQRSGISDTLIRISVGIEDADDLLEDLEQALRQDSVESNLSRHAG